jgi:type I restriction enzyme, S subunit
LRWPEVPIDAIADVKGGKRLPDGHQFASEPTPFLYIRARDIGAGKISVQEPVYLHEHTRRILDHYTVQKDDVVITIVGANIGDVGYVSEEFDGANLTENAAKIVVNRAAVNPYFLKSFLATAQNKNRFAFIASGAAQGKLGLYKIKQFVVPLPPLDIQNRIAGLVRNYDDLIENNRQRVALLEEAARLLYREWFVRFRFPGHEHVKIIDGMPEGWERLPASQAFEVNPTTPRDDEGTITYVPMAALSEAGMVVDRTPFEERQASTSVRFRNGDTLFARITPCLENGKTGFVQFLVNDEVACGSTEFIVLRGRRISNYFVYLTAR